MLDIDVVPGITVTSGGDASVPIWELSACLIPDRWGLDRMIGEITTHDVAVVVTVRKSEDALFTLDVLIMKHDGTIGYVLPGLLDAV